jgi:hypothetical protein
MKNVIIWPRIFVHEISNGRGSKENRVLYLKHNLNYNSTYKLRWHQYNEKNEFFLLETIYRTTLQQILKMSNTFMKTGILLFYRVSCDFVKFFSASGLARTLSLRNHYRKNFGWIRSGKRGGQRPVPIMRSPNKSWNKELLAVRIFATSRWNQQFLTSQHCPMSYVFPVANTSCVPKFWYQPVYCCLNTIV